MKQFCAFCLFIGFTVACGSIHKDKKHNDQPAPDDPGNSSTTAPGAGQSKSTTKVDEFYQLAGLSYGDSLARGVEVFNKNARVHESSGDKLDFRTFWYDYQHLSLSAEKSSGKITSFIMFTGTVQKLKDRGITDPKLNLIGKSHDEIVAVLGQPTDPNNKRIIEYVRSRNNKRDLSISFACNEDGTDCSLFIMDWWY